ncbi:MAG: aminotransferase class V-fold PLP-dependent enzyme [Segetibacter sp.]
MKFGIKFHYINMHDANHVNDYINNNTKLIWLETPTNPLMNITDIEAVAALAKPHKILVCVDNTFASPYLQNPLDLGADMVMHSATKYLGGHSDVIHGCLMLNDQELRDKLYFIQKSCGGSAWPAGLFSCTQRYKNFACTHAATLREWRKNSLFSSQSSKGGESVLVWV